MASHAAPTEVRRADAGAMPAAGAWRWFFVPLVCGLVLPALFVPLTDAGPQQQFALEPVKIPTPNAGESNSAFLIASLREEGASLDDDALQAAIAFAQRCQSAADSPQPATAAEAEDTFRAAPTRAIGN